MIKQANFEYLTLAVGCKDVVQLVEQSSTRMAQKVKDVTSFEHTCYVNIGKEMARRKVVSVKAMSLHYIKRAEARHIKKGKHIPNSFMDDLKTRNKEGQTVEYEPVDVLANVESALETKETITLLAKDDRRRKMILTEWMYGNTDETNISRILADTLGGNARSHCKFVQRFKIECRSALNAADAM